ncbi:gastrin/cholecystokinin-like peptide [Leucoraja erinacea]|uniref:gastrin/cholecystokinin-like peptide n=1 Tax=Leucoraja erinaceus TaxID=7782 RepID=UPI0024559CA5|nr:gastrin/cholecystokinin-like peptide [Leucoraja erinacea]
MTNTVCISLLVVVLAIGCLSTPLSGPRSGSALLRERGGKSPSAAGPGSLGRRAATLRTDELVSRLLPQIQEAALLEQADRYQLRDVLHQMHDRDYTGWMDFGRRSVDEEYDLDS